MPSLSDRYVRYVLSMLDTRPHSTLSVDDCYMDADALWIVTSDEPEPLDLPLYRAFDYLENIGAIEKARNYRGDNHTTMRYRATTTWGLAAQQLPLAAALRAGGFLGVGCSADWLDVAWSVVYPDGPMPGLWLVALCDEYGGSSLVLRVEHPDWGTSGDTLCHVDLAHVTRDEPPLRHLGISAKARALRTAYRDLLQYGEDLSN